MHPDRHHHFMPETSPNTTLQWLADGTPFSPRFGDRYHSSANHGLDQARGVFLHGCGLPAAWAHHPQWRVLETGFGLGLNFLVTWAAWRADPARPRTLHFVSCEAWPVDAADLVRAAPPDEEIQTLAAELARQFNGLLPGVHRLVFEQGQVQLTLLIGDAQALLRAQRPQADSVYLDGFDPRRNPAMWDPHTLKTVARCCRRGARLATWCCARQVRETLAQSGFEVRKVPGVPPKRENLHAVFDPRWEPHPTRPALPGVTLPGIPGERSAMIIGAGLAGAAVAASLARRGWRVTVLDGARQPASGASGVPAAILAPHSSPDDGVLSRLSRAGVRTTLLALEMLAADLRGTDWDAAGVLERSLAGTPRLAWNADAGLRWSAPATAAQCQACHLPLDAPGLWHANAGWLRPETLVGRMLAQPGIIWRGDSAVRHLAPDRHAAQGWEALDDRNASLARADLVVVCAGAQSNALLPQPLPLQPARGMVSWGMQAPDDAPWPAYPVNGHGTFIPGTTATGMKIWVLGATFERGIDALPLDASEEASGHAANHTRLGMLLPALAQALAPQFHAGSTHAAQAWSGVRCTTPDHLPFVGPIDAAVHPGLWVCTGLGARGATLATLCAELLAARLHDEPLPLDASLARALGTERCTRRPAQSSLRQPESSPS